MRFCLITTFYPPYAFGGDAIFIYRQANLLARLGHEVEVIHCVDSYESLATTPSISPLAYPHEKGVTVHSLRSWAGILSPLATQQTGYPLFKSKKIQQILSAKKFDVINFHNISLVGGPMILSYGEGVKLYTMHEHWLICPTHVMFKFNKAVCIEKDCFKCTLSYRRPPQLWRYTNLLNSALGYVDAFIALSKFTLEIHKGNGLNIPFVYLPPFLSQKAEPINSTKVEHLQATKEIDLKLPERPFFLFVGRLEKLKGLQDVIPIFQNYKQADLVIAGDGNFARELKELANNSENIHFLGQLSSEKLKILYKKAIALIVPSLTYEVFNQVILESYSTQTPVIVRNLGPLPEIVAKSQGGLVFNNSQDLKEKLEQMQNTSNLRDQLGLSGYKTCSTQWTEEAHMKSYFNLIEEIGKRKSLSKKHNDK